MDKPLKKVGTPAQKGMTRNLLKFCHDHNHTEHWIAVLEEFSVALAARDVEKLQRLIALLRVARMGSFVEWFPPVVFEHEDANYVQCVWNCLYGAWLNSVLPITELKNAQPSLQADRPEKAGPSA